MPLISNMQMVKEAAGLGYVHQAIDLLPIALRRYNLGLSDYYVFGLYRFWRKHRERRRDFIGWRYQTAASELLNDRQGVTCAWDKIAFHELLEYHELPSIRNKAAFAPSRTYKLDGVALGSERALAEFLRSDKVGSTYVKAAFSQQGFNNFYIKARDGELLIGHNGERRSIPIYSKS